MANPTRPAAAGDRVSAPIASGARDDEPGGGGEPPGGIVADREEGLPGDGSLTVAAVRWEAPYPPPHIIERYERVSPGLGKRIVEQAMAESEHVRARDREALAGATGFLARGQRYGFALGLAVIGVAVFAIHEGAAEVAMTALGVIAAVAAVFVYRARSEKRSR